MKIDLCSRNLRDPSRFYQNLTDDIVRTKNRLHKVLQVTFPDFENLLATQTGEQYWNLATAFPCKGFVLDLNHTEPISYHSSIHLKTHL